MNIRFHFSLITLLAVTQISLAQTDLDFDSHIKNHSSGSLEQLANIQLPPIQALPGFQPLFQSYQMLQLDLKTNFTTLWQHRQKPNQPEDPVHAQYAEDGQLTVTDANGKSSVVNVKVKLRGNSSQDPAECPFPKLKLKFDRAAVQGTILEGMSSVNLATHCGDSGGKSKWLKRQWNGLSPHREALLYRAMQQAQIFSFKARPAFANYTDIGSGQVYLNKQAFFLEDLDSMLETHQMAEILGADTPLAMRVTDPAKASKKKYLFQSAMESPVNLFEVGKIFLFQSLVQNIDWHLKVNPTDQEKQNLWNIKVVEMSANDWFVFCYDFDLSGAVTGRSGPQLDRLFRERFPLAARQAVVKHFLNAKDILYGLESELSHDPEGAQFYRRRLDDFYSNIANFL
jgi:hypothetical protein